MPNQLQQRNKYNLTTETMFADCARNEQASITSWLAENPTIVAKWSVKYGNRSLNGLTNILASFKAANLDFSLTSNVMFQHYIERLIAAIELNPCADCSKRLAEYNDMCEGCFDAYQVELEDANFGGSTSLKPRVQETLENPITITTNENHPPVFSYLPAQEAVNNEQLAASLIPNNEENKPNITNPKPEVSKCPFCGKGETCDCWEKAGAMQEIGKITKQELVAFALENAPEITACVHKRLNKDGVSVTNLMYVECDNRINIAWAIFENLTAWELPQNYKQHFTIASNKKNNAGKPYKVYSIALHGKNDCECYDFVGSANKHNGWCKHVLVGLIIYYTALLYKRYHAVVSTQEKVAA